jgi:hypothetical protein
MRAPQNKLQPPFREETLLSTSLFRSFCDKNGIHLWQSDLKLLWEKQLLFPAIKCFLSGFPVHKVYMEQNEKKAWYIVDPENLKNLEYEKLDPQTYYREGAVYFNRPKKGGRYKKGFKKMKYTFPSQDKSDTSDLKLEALTHETLTSPEPFEKDYTVYFDKTQVLILKIILERCGYHYNRLDTKRLENQDLIKNLQTEIQEQQRFLRVFQDWRDMLFNFNEACQEKSDEAWKLYPKDKKERDQEYKGFYDFELSERKPLFETILQKYKVSEEEVIQWRDFLVSKSFFNEYSFHFPFLRKYLKEIKNRTLENNEYINLMVADLNWALEIVTGKESSLSEALQHMDGYKLCEICKVGFKPRNRKQVTCGSKPCKCQHKKRLKQANNYYRK